MPSVIPARLQFQCGHAALVTLPRVKGETATQRNDRVAREKTAALARQCDFCAPSVAVVEPQLAAANGSHVEFALSDVAEPTSVTELAVVVTNESDATAEAEQTTPEAMDTEPAIVSHRARGGGGRRAGAGRASRDTARARGATHRGEACAKASPANHVRADSPHKQRPRPHLHRRNPPVHDVRQCAAQHPDARPPSLVSASSSNTGWTAWCAPRTSAMRCARQTRWVPPTSWPSPAKTDRRIVYAFAAKRKRRDGWGWLSSTSTSPKPARVSRAGRSAGSTGTHVSPSCSASHSGEAMLSTPTTTPPGRSTRCISLNSWSCASR